MTENALPCGKCGCRSIKIQRRSGTAGRTPLTRTRWYRETVTCNNCGIIIQAKSPGTAVQIWNQASMSRGALKSISEDAC